MRQFENLKMIGCLVIIMTLSFNCKRVDINIEKANAPVAIADSVVKQTTTVEECDSDFDVFFKKFAVDSVFQKSHIKFPLKNSRLDDDYQNIIREDIPLSKYTFIDFDIHKDAMKQEFDKFNVEVEKHKDSVFYFMKGYDNGIMTEIKFSYDGSCWKMVEIIDEST